MPEQNLKAGPETIQYLDNSKWKIYTIGSTGFKDSNALWHFTTEGNVHDEPEVWSGKWEKTSNNQITIHRKNVNPPYDTYKYIATFVSGIFVASGKDETSDNRILVALQVG